MGLGFHKPHLAWQFPKKYWDKTPANPPVAKHQAFPADVPGLAWHECAECSTWNNPANRSEGGRIGYFNSDAQGFVLPNQQWQSDMRRAYYSAISYVDGLIGEVLDTLKRLELEDSTVVSFTGEYVRADCAWCDCAVHVLCRVIVLCLCRVSVLCF